MAIPKTTIKTPCDFPVKGPNAKSPGTFNGLPGYEKRTGSPNAVAEKTLDGVKPSQAPSIKSPVPEK